VYCAAPQVNIVSAGVRVFQLHNRSVGRARRVWGGENGLRGESMRVGVRVPAQSIDTACLLACLPVRHQDTRGVPLQAAHGWFAIHATLHGYGHDRLGVLSTCQPVERRM
jgi:hypothetical protein